ncbi:MULTISPECIES: hypothetical protein [unclassified Oscillibacter]|uniref:hypothetical protein n=1 Tax=unclassified Oscillibacter TaxID=2629304 RepID=UPI0025F460CF|nr:MULTISPECIES: hypothetical protein [unclassified Oscillibacter]
MKFIIGENGWSWLERITYRGAIGLFYDSTLGGVLTYLIFGTMCILAVVGLITVLKLLFFRKKKISPEEKWLKTGKF